MSYDVIPKTKWKRQPQSLKKETSRVFRLSDQCYSNSRHFLVSINTYLGIEVVCQTVDVLTLYGILASHQGEVMGQLFMGCDDCTMAKLVKLGSTRSTKDLHHVQDPQIHKGALLGVIDLCSLQIISKSSLS